MPTACTATSPGHTAQRGVVRVAEAHEQPESWFTTMTEYAFRVFDYVNKRNEAHLFTHSRTYKPEENFAEHIAFTCPQDGSTQP